MSKHKKHCCGCECEKEQMLNKIAHYMTISSLAKAQARRLVRIMQARMMGESEDIELEELDTDREIDGMLKGIPKKKDLLARRKDFQTLQSVLRKVAHRGHRQRVIQILHSYGAEKLSDVDPSDYVSLLCDVMALL